MSSDAQKKVRFRRAIQVAAAACLMLAAGGCLSTGPSERQQKGDRLLFSEAQKSFDARDYVDAITKFRLFLEQFPKSPQYSWALQRLGESYEGLLEVAFSRRLQRGEDPGAVQREFLQQYGHYKVWQEDADGIRYNKAHYREVIEKYPDSPIADETEYRLIDWVRDYRGEPDAVAGEVARLEAVLEKYPSTSLRPEILYKIARRCRILYEIAAFSPRAQFRNSDKAEQYRSKAVYAYQLCLKSPEHTDYAQKAWAELKSLEDGKRIYILQ
jgi:outer membrane protein assembly factor BamD (BamD/ComL family)